MNIFTLFNSQNDKFELKNPDLVLRIGYL